MNIEISCNSPSVSNYNTVLDRLNITPVTSPVSRGSSRKLLKGKRKRTFIEESDETDISNYSVTSSSKCEISITEVDGEGKFVKLMNKSNKEVALGGWQIARKAGLASTVYKFSRTFKIEPGATVTIWSSDIPDRPHDPPENLVMKGQKWVIADDMTTTLNNNSGEEVAIAEHKKQQLSDKTSKRQREGSSFLSKRSFMASSSMRSSTEPQNEERCVIM